MGRFNNSFINISKQATESTLAANENVNNNNIENTLDTNENANNNEVNPLQSIFRNIPTEQISLADNNPFNADDNEEDIKALSYSINSIGLLHPLVVNDTGNGKYTLISGERRLKAIKMLGWLTVPCHVIQENNKELIDCMLYSANLEVRNTSNFKFLLFCIQLQKIYKKLYEANNISGSVRKAVADKINISERTLAKFNYIDKRLDLLTNEELSDLESDKLTANKAYSIIQSREKDNSNDTAILNNETPKQELPEQQLPDNDTAIYNNVQPEYQENIDEINVVEHTTESTEEHTNEYTTDVNNEYDDVNSSDEHDLYELSNSGFESNNSVELTNEDGKAFEIDKAVLLNNLPVVSAVRIDTHKNVFGNLVHLNDDYFVIYKPSVEHNEDKNFYNINFFAAPVDIDTVQIKGEN